MRTAVLHALALATNTTTPFLAVMVLPVWEDTPWQSAAIRAHTNMDTIITIPACHMRFVPTHNHFEGDTDTLTPAKWPVELILISDEEGENTYLDMKRI